MIETTDIVDNILLAGYLREHDAVALVPVAIPRVVESLISDYCKECVTRAVGNSSDIFLAKTDRPLTNTFISESVYPQMNEIMETSNDKVIDIQGGDAHTLFLTAKGCVYSIGENGSGQCGQAKQMMELETPKKIPFRCKIKSIACGAVHSLFLDEYGKLLVCGLNFSGQLGQRIDSVCDFDTDSDSDEDSDSEFGDMFECARQCVYTPIYNKYFEDLNIRFKTISCGLHHSLCITAADGQCYTFGHNAFGELGNGRRTEYGRGEYIPYHIKTSTKFVSGVCGKDSNILITARNEIMVWGNNQNHQCSVRNKELFLSPNVLSKKEEFGVEENFFIEKAIYMQYNKSEKATVVVDIYKRCVGSGI